MSSAAGIGLPGMTITQRNLDGYGSAGDRLGARAGRADGQLTQAPGTGGPTGTRYG